MHNPCLDIDVGMPDQVLQVIKVGRQAELYPEGDKVVVREIHGKHAVCSLLGEFFEFQVDLDDLLPC